MDQGELVDDAGALAPRRSALTPVRALLIALAAVLGGVALSLALGSSPAHAAESADPGPDSPLGPTTTAVSSLVGAVDHAMRGAVSTASTTIGASVPLVQHSVDAAGESVATHVPVAAPIVAPLTAALDATLGGVRQVVAPVVQQAPSISGLRAPASALHAVVTGATALVSTASPAGSAVGILPAPQRGAGSDGALPGPVLTGAPGSSAAAFGLLLGAFALLLLGARRRQHDEALPASPAFDLDTSPA